MALNERDVRRLAWEFADEVETKNNSNPLPNKDDLVKNFANAMWKILYPSKTLWTIVPQKP